MNSELHPLEPFLPANARILMLGSFPPKRIRWSMDFFYPNLQNDMWRIVGYLAAGDKSHFLMPGGRKFDKERIEAFCRERGIALYDTAVEVIRLKDNASDNFLQVVREVDLAALLARIPVVNSVYKGVKQVSDTIFSPGGNAFRKPLLVQYPRQGSWTIAFLTGAPGGDVANHLHGEYVSVYVPTTPNPTSGFFLMMPKADVVELAMSVDEALKYIISMGVVAPPVPLASNNN